MALSLDAPRAEAVSDPAGDSAFAALASLLEQQLASARALHAALKRKQDVLVKNRLSELQTTAEEAITLAIELARLEELRLDELERLAQQGCLPSTPKPAAFNTELLLRSVPERERSLLQRPCRELAREIQTLSETNLQNDNLMHNLAEYTGTVLRLLTRQDSAPTYGRSGGVQSGPAGRPLLDSRV
jgi:flagellar biosynthesis/type III secretory pathway chaperone